MHRLLILPHAGGSAHNYMPLRKTLGSDFAVQCHELPGRGKRTRNAFVPNWDAAVDDVISATADLRRDEWSVFGHSMGALLAHAVIRRLVEEGGSLPRHIFASGTMAPSARRRVAISDLPKQAFWSKVRAYGGVPAEILAVSDFMDFFENILRSDFRLLERGPVEAFKVPVPITVLYGTDEMTLDQAESWLAESSRSVRAVGFPGHHFYLSTQLGEVADTIRAALSVS